MRGMVLGGLYGEYYMRAGVLYDMRGCDREGVI